MFRHNGSSDNSLGGANSLNIGTITNNNFAFITNDTERMRITSAGVLCVNRTSLITAGNVLAVNHTETGSPVSIQSFWAGDTGDRKCISFFNSGGSESGFISVTSATAVNFASSSDYRLKEDWQPVANAITRLNQLKPVNFAWKVDGSRVDGFLAHEAQEVVPEAVTGTKDAVDAKGNPEYQGIDQAKLVPLLTAALQEAIAKIAVLEARLDAANL
jgi:hypothetical protein